MVRIYYINLKVILVLLVCSLSVFNVYSEQSIIAPLASKSLLLDSDNYADLTVVVGERGHVLYSTDQQTWTQALVETRSTLTSVFLLDDNTGWAVGHDAVILRTIDGAKTWQKVFSAIEEEAPLLDVFFWDKFAGIAIGAYGLVYLSNDGGLSWKKSELIITNLTGSEDFNEIYDFHLNNLVNAGDHHFYIAAEAGHILFSDDNAKTWQDLQSPYHGSFFGVLSISEDEVLVYGLRGHLYRSEDAGTNWSKIDTGTKEMLTNAILLSNGDIVLAGLAGTLLLSRDEGQSFTKINLKQRYSVSSLLETDKGDLLLTTDEGIKVVAASLLRSQ
ncbi:MAG: YCF48-related protein [Proteobacteria bacterium]|nr:YCF48-related protein [Pseudomonadota bacterium]